MPNERVTLIGYHVRSVTDIEVVEPYCYPCGKTINIGERFEFIQVTGDMTVKFHSSCLRQMTEMISAHLVDTKTEELVH